MIGWRFDTFARITCANGAAVRHQPGEDERCSGPDEAEDNLGAVTPEL